MERDTSEEILAELIGVFVGESRKRIEEIDDLAEGPLEDLVAAAHAIKSSASTFGARHLQQLAAAVEQRARDGEEGAGEDVSALVEAAERTLAAYTERFGPWETS